MNKLLTMACVLFTFLFTSCIASEKHYTLTSPNDNLILETGIIDGRPYYSIKRGSEKIIDTSFLGFTFADGAFNNNFRVTGTNLSSFDETWIQPWGEDIEVRNNYNELILNLQELNGKKRKMSIIFRLFNDGAGFRYVFPEQKGLSDFVIMDEETEYNLPFDAQAWTIPTNGTKYYEALYTKSSMSAKDTVCTPVTLEVNDSLFITLHEANLTDYAGLNLRVKSHDHSLESNVKLITSLTPWSTGEKVFAAAPFASPWRTIIIADKPGDLLLSRLMLNLNDPCVIEDTSWITPGRYIGIWWGMHMEKYTWHQGEKHGATTENTKRYIDFAAKHGFNGVLVEGWNLGWEGDWTAKGNEFSFTHSYPDYDMYYLADYAKQKGVRLIGHHETGGSALNYEQQLDSAFALCNELDIQAVKTGYVNPMLDHKELQHSQYGIRHYRKVVETAAKYKIMIDNHEPAMPSGLQRTYPNLMTQEGVRGQEYNAWCPDGGNPPSHTCIIPFTRGLAGPMDFTPGIFNFSNTAYPGTRPQTTLAKQLALSVILFSPLQMAADMIENYENQSAFSFITSCPTTWSKTIVPHAEIGEYITIARKSRYSDDWFIGSITADEARTMELKLDFLDENCSYKATIYADGKDADYKNNPYSINIETIEVNANNSLNLYLTPSGGAAVSIEKM